MNSYPVKITLTSEPAGWIRSAQYFARVPVCGDWIVMLGEKGSQIGDRHVRVTEVLLLPVTDDALVPVAEVRVVLQR